MKIIKVIVDEVPDSCELCELFVNGECPFEEMTEDSVCPLDDMESK